jgi:hypothetical protein
VRVGMASEGLVWPLESFPELCEFTGRVKGVKIDVAAAAAMQTT